MQKPIYFLTNTKQSMGPARAVAFLEQLQSLTEDLVTSKTIDLSVMPSYTSLYPTRSVVKKGGILLGAQDVCESNEIEYTGQVSADMLRELDLDVVMVGHSERRRIYQESNALLNQKVLRTLEAGMRAVLSISETGRDKATGVSPEVLRMQLKECLAGAEDAADRIHILYEPAWAIGVHGEVASPEYAGAMHRVIRACLKEMYGPEAGSRIPVLYGGSVNKQNAVALFAQDEVDGLGIGRAAWNAEDFNEIIRMVLATA